MGVLHPQKASSLPFLLAILLVIILPLLPLYAKAEEDLDLLSSEGQHYDKKLIHQELTFTRRLLGRKKKPYLLPIIVHKHPPKHEEIQVSHDKNKDKKNIPKRGVSIKQEVVMSWKEKGKKKNRYMATIRNFSSTRMDNVKMLINGLKGPIWGISRIGSSNIYSFSSPLPPFGSLTFTYEKLGGTAFDASCKWGDWQVYKIGNSISFMLHKEYMGSFEQVKKIHGHLKGI